MAAVPPADDAAVLLKNLTLDSQAKSFEILDPVKKSSVDNVNGQIPPSNKGVTPLITDALAYYPNGYPSSAYYYGGYDGTANWLDDGADLANLYGYGYGYSPYAAYSPAGSPVAQHYHYPSTYFQPPTPTGGSHPPTASPTKGETITPATANQPPLATDTTKGNVGKGVGNNGSLPVKPSAYQNSGFNTNGSYGVGGQNGYLDPRFGYNGAYSTTQNHLKGPNSMSMYPNKFYGQYGNTYRSSYCYGTNGYYSPNNGFKPRGRGNGCFGYNNENNDGLNELNRGPRLRATKNQELLKPADIAVEGQELALSPTDSVKNGSIEVNVTPDREQYNKAEFPETYADAKFFIIKSYSEDDVHKSIKYNVWASTQNGNKKLDDAYREAQQKSEGCPVFLFFSVNTSGQFVGVAEMVGHVDFNKSLEYWQQDKWVGCFPVKWHIVKDIPNSLLKDIILEYNENKPVTNSRDTQEVKLVEGLQMIKIFKEHSSKQCVLDDFEFYEERQKKIQQKKAKQHEYQKQLREGKHVTDKNIKEGIEAEVLKSDDGMPDLVNEVKLEGNVQDDVSKQAENVVVNEVANAC